MSDLHEAAQQGWPVRPSPIYAGGDRCAIWESLDTAHIHPTAEVQALLIELRLTRNVADFDAACRRHGIDLAR